MPAFNIDYLPILLLFLLSYFLTLLAFILILQNAVSPLISYLTELNMGVAASSNKWITLLAILAFSGLPPFLLFFAKLSLLSWIYAHASWKVLTIALVLILLGWSIYSTAVIKLLSQSWTSASSIKNLNHPLLFLLSVCLSFSLLIGGFWFTDLWLFLNWAFGFTVF